MTRKRVKLDLDEFLPDAAQDGPDKETLIEKTDVVAAEHGFTSRETKKKKKKDPRGRPSKANIRQLTISSTVEDVKWFAEIRAEMGWTGGKLFAEMRAAFEQVQG